MELQNYPRIRKAIQDAIDGLELEASCYGYREAPEYTNLIVQLQNYLSTIEAKQKEHQDTVERE